MRRIFLSFFLCFCLLSLFIIPVTAAEKVSKPGEYSGYSEAVYDNWIRLSRYVTVQEGTPDETQLAIPGSILYRRGWQNS